MRSGIKDEKMMMGTERNTTSPQPSPPQAAERENDLLRVYPGRRRLLPSCPGLLSAAPLGLSNGRTARDEGMKMIYKQIMKTILVSICVVSLWLTAGCVASVPPPSAAQPVVLREFKLTGKLNGDRAAFTMNAVAHVEGSRGGRLPLLAGTVALTEMGKHPQWRVVVEQNQFVLEFDRGGDIPVEIKFSAAVRQRDGWNSVNFRIAPSSLQPITLQGLAADTQFQFAGAARPERKGEDFLSYLPADGAVTLAWKEGKPEAEGKLFYAAEMLSQISVSPGLMRQTALLDFKVMQGELNTVTLRLRGEGEVTRVAGNQVLAWNVENVPNSADRRLVVRLNQPQRDQFALQVQMQTPLGAFPQTTDAMQLRPESATRFAGYYRIVNEGAVRLEVAQASGLSQISPEQFPESDATKAILRPGGTQRFAYRFSGGDFALRIQADQILPELGVSQVLAYHLGENEQAIDAEIELDIREAPLRELLVRVPKGYAIARLTASGMSDYFVRDAADDGDSELRLVYGQPMSGRQVVQLRLERNQALGGLSWALPRVEVSHAKSVRGNLAVSSDAGFRLTAERTQGLTEIATAFFPRKVAGIQTAFRLSDPAWSASMRVERLPQTVQADAFHLFSIGEGVAYGSSVINYTVSGAPVSAFRVELSDEYFNVEFTGKDVRNWQKTAGGYLVQLHTPVSGPYTLLATYERPFKSQGETLVFTGARPLDAQSEQGHTLVISAYQFDVKPVDVSAGLLPLETAEVPSEYRLFFDAPILAAYRYTSRPFNLKLALSPLAQGESLSQVVDRAILTTHISKEGQVLTDVRYFVKNRGNPNFKITLPAGTELWSALVNGAAVVPVKDGNADLIPLPQRNDPNAVLKLDLKLASTSKDARSLAVAAPIVGAPVMLAEWDLKPDTGQRLEYRSGSLTPVGGVVDVSGFAQVARVPAGPEAGRAGRLLLVALILVGVAAVAWRWGCRTGVARLSARHLAGTSVGLVAFAAGVALLFQLGDIAQSVKITAPNDVTFLAPVQKEGASLSVEVGNLAEAVSWRDSIGRAWPVAIAAALWIYGWLAAGQIRKFACSVLGWTIVSWAVLRLPNSAAAFEWVVLAFLLFNVAIPALRKLWGVPVAPQPRRVAGDEGGGAPAVAALIVGGLICVGMGVTQAHAAESPMNTGRVHTPMLTPPTPMAESVNQQIRVEEKFALATVKIHWQAEKGQSLPLLYEPGVLTKATYPVRALKLVQGVVGNRRVEQLVALESGSFDIEAQYELQVAKRENESGFMLPTQRGLINQLKVTLSNLDVDVLSPQAVAIQRETSGSNTVASLVLSPLDDVWVGWKPRSRDVKGEKSVFYAEVYQLYVPSAGVIEGAHYAAIRPAQGELSELIFDVPAGATVTDVIDPAANAPADANVKAPGPSLLSLWRFDPDTRKLRVTLSHPQSRPFALVIRSQVATGPLPVEQGVGLLSVENAAGQIGLLGVATGNEVQLDSVTADGFSAINLEDFPSGVGQTLQAQIPGLTVRRAFRYADAKGRAILKASAVEPDVRVETQDTLSLGEDRIVLASKATVDITRAGIFRLSFLLPQGMDVESVSGAALSHWTESKSEAGRAITLHLRGKTEGQQQFDISLAGPGIKATNGWGAPKLILREAGKQRGTLLIVPEQGMRLQVATRDGVTQLDPQRVGIRQKGVLAFRILQTPWNLAMDLEQVDPWIQVTSLQHAMVNEAQVKVIANLQYQIENTGLKAFHVYLPTNAVSVQFQGDQVAAFQAQENSITNGMQLWEVKLHRRVIGQYLLQASYQTAVADQAAETALRGVQAADVNLQRGFVTVQSGGRLQLRVDAAPGALQPAEWQSIPRALQQDLRAASANFCYRLVEPAFQLALKLDRHEAAKLLPARVNSITFTSVISDNGTMLTQARIEMLPGDKRLLNLMLPKDAKFWFAFVNHNGVWPWRKGDDILIPLEQQTHDARPIPVEIFYTSQIGQTAAKSLDLNLVAPKFDLPLEKIEWRVYLNDKWQVKQWAGALQLQSEQIVKTPAAADLEGYLQGEAAAHREKTKEAEEMLAMGNSLLQNGSPQEARRAFQAAYGLSQGDDAFNEDARVQLNNLKLQQALVGFNVRQSAAGGEAGALAGKFRDWRGRKEIAYTQQDAKDIIDRNTADDNAVFMRLAERLIQQQDAAVSSPAAIRANVPEQGRVLTFRRSVAVNERADLNINLRAEAVKVAPRSVRVTILAGVFLGMAVIALGAISFRTKEQGQRMT